MNGWLGKYAAMTLSAAIGVFAYQVVPWADVESGTWTSWVQAVGSVGAILVAVWVMRRQNDDALSREISSSRSETANVLRALAVELQTHLDFVAQMQDVELKAIMPTHQWHFYIYRACAGSIGKIDDDELRGNIVQLYGAIDTLYQRNNRRTEALIKLRAEPDHPIYKSDALALHEGFVETSTYVHVNGPGITARIRAAANAMTPAA
jgi:hypothetical protein